MSFAVTMGVTITESVMGSLPLSLALWYFNIRQHQNNRGSYLVVRRGYSL